MANASLTNIYNRINGVNNYHPYTAETFADWSLEAGDIVTVGQDGTQYASPIHTATVTWNGHQRVTLESNGEKERGPLSKMSSDAYNSGNGGGNGYRGGYRASKTDQEMGTLIDNNREAILLEAWNRENADDQFDTRITQTAEAITIEANRRRQGDNDLSSRIDIEAGKISMVVDETSGGNVIKAASIVAAINNAGSSVVIEADHIRLNGTTSLNDVLTVSGGLAYFRKTAVFDAGGSSMVTISGGGIGIHGYMMKVADASVSGNVLTITFNDGRSPITFSKATTLTGAWSGNITAGMSYKVTAKQNGATVATHYSPQLDAYYMGTKSWADNYHTLNLPVTVYDANGTDLYRETLSIDTSASYSAGASSVSPDTKTQRNDLYCTSATVIGSGQSDYTFSATLPTSRFSSGRTYTFWRVP